ncbi:MAG TPA: pteridine reductase [Steroidobacteraceae bacterium]|nr:pteridine reductase [Steroidobacteraceae bacterium]
MTTPTDGAALADQVALITGAARRVGAEIARTLHGAGARVMIHHRSSHEAAEALAAELNGRRPGSAATIEADLLSAAAPARLMQGVLEQFGRLDLLVNNASTFYPTPVGKITLAQWEDLMGSNLRAPLFLSQAAAPSLAERRGLILNLVDIHAQRPLRHFPLYSVAKAGLAMLTRALARELAPEVRVNGIAPGPVLWPEHGMDEALKQEIIGKTALKRAGTPRDIARAVLFFAHDAPYVTGQILTVDGGRSL